MEEAAVAVGTMGPTVIQNPELVYHNVDRGLDIVLGHENIAIVVLMVMVLMESTMIYYLLRNLFKTKDVLQKLHTAITILNERLSHHGDEH